MKPHVPCSVQSDVETRIGRVSQLAASIRERRNRVIAHSDLATVTGVVPVSATTFDEMNSVAAEIAALLNVVQGCFRPGSSTGYENGIVQGGGAQEVLYLLKAGLRHDKDCDPELSPSGWGRGHQPVAIHLYSRGLMDMSLPL